MWFYYTYISLQIFLWAAYPGNLWVCVDNWWDTIVVNMYWTSCNTFHANKTFIFCFMGQHRSMDTVTNGIDTATTYTHYSSWHDPNMCIRQKILYIIRIWQAKQEQRRYWRAFINWQSTNWVVSEDQKTKYPLCDNSVPLHWMGSSCLH